MTYIADARFVQLATTLAGIADANQPPCPLVVDRVVVALVEADIAPLSIAADVIRAGAEHAEKLALEMRT